MCEKNEGLSKILLRRRLDKGIGPDTWDNGLVTENANERLMNIAKTEIAIINPPPIFTLSKI